MGATLIMVNILMVPRLGAGTVGAILVSSLVIWVCRGRLGLIVVLHHRSIWSLGSLTEGFEPLAWHWDSRTCQYFSFLHDESYFSECYNHHDFLGHEEILQSGFRNVETINP